MLNIFLFHSVVGHFCHLLRNVYSSHLLIFLVGCFVLLLSSLDSLSTLGVSSYPVLDLHVLFLTPLSFALLIDAAFVI